MRLVPVATARLRSERNERPGSVQGKGPRRVTALAAATTSRRPRLQSHPVVEIFGPTIQGEGAEAGLATHFVRFGGCDFRCAWCDTMYAVEPAAVRRNAERLSTEEIVERVEVLGGAPRWVTLSGGNPA